MTCLSKGTKNNLLGVDGVGSVHDAAPGPREVAQGPREPEQDFHHTSPLIKQSTPTELETAAMADVAAALPRGNPPSTHI